MSLTVTPTLVEAAQADALTDAAFLDCVRASLPFAYDLVARLAAELPDAVATGRGFADHQDSPPTDEEQGQVLRAMASTAIRTALERHFDVSIVFQNCHRVAVFVPASVGGRQYDRFTSAAAQVLNQRPDLVNC